MSCYLPSCSHAKDLSPCPVHPPRPMIIPAEVSGAAAEVVPGGALREGRNTDYSQLSHIALRLMAETQGEGNAKYGYGNWQKGLPVSNLLSHAVEHILKLQNGDVTENHLGHALWNLEKAAHFIETRPDLVDVLPMRKSMGLDAPAPDKGDKGKGLMMHAPMCTVWSAIDGMPCTCGYSDMVKEREKGTNAAHKD